jgi:F0F1-type ATP synthase assembly protein I
MIVLDMAGLILFRLRPIFSETLRPPPSMTNESGEFRKGLSIAARIGVELVAALVVGAGLGYLADWYFDTSPWLVVVGLFLGMSAGLLNIYRTASRL